MSKPDKYFVLPHLEQFLIPIEKLKPLPGNARRGDVDGIIAAYQEFGQVKAIVVVPNDGEDTYTVIAGNHQLEAAKQMEWTHMAATPVSWNEARSRAFALVDNRTHDMGGYDNNVLFEEIMGSDPTYSDLFGELGWDDFELGAMEEAFLADQAKEDDDSGIGWTPPEIIEREPTPTTPESFSLDTDSDEETRRAVVQGATSVGREGAKAVVQTTIVFDHADQQKDWYSFLRWLKEQPEYEALETTAAQVIQFLKDNVDFE